MAATEIASLPTLDKLGVGVGDLQDVDPSAIARSWFQSFSDAISSGTVADIIALFAPISPLWRDILCLSWDFHTQYGSEKIKQFLEENLAASGLSALSLNEQRFDLQRPAPDLAWIPGFFSFETKVGHGSGIFRLVPIRSEGSTKTEWKAHALFSNLESLKGFPEKIGSLREQNPLHGGWTEKREKETEFTGDQPKPVVIVVGGGQGGLQVAARLKVLDVPTLVVEKQARVGDQWRGRYEALCLHDPVWYDHMPYLPFPPTWPVWTPARKLGDWLESYAHALELNVWTSSTVTKVVQDPGTTKWTVTIDRANGGERKFTVNHVVFAPGFGGGIPKMPKIDGMDEFGGKIIHSIDYTRAKEYAEKKVVVLGACTSAHDICSDLAKHGVDVTMYQRNHTYVMSTTHGVPRALPAYFEDGPPVDVADRISASFPWLLSLKMSVQITKAIKACDQDMLDGLQRSGFKAWDGPNGAGFAGLLWERGGGYYFDTGACQLIIDGKIKIKNGSPLKQLRKDVLEFEDGSTVPADVVICATGFGDARLRVAEMCGDEVAGRLKPFWGLDAEGEVNGLWRPSGVQGLWIQMGNLAMGRFHSKHIALQIKAMEEGIAPSR